VLHFATTYLLIVSQVEVHSFWIPTALSDLKSLKTALLEVLICSKSDRVFILHLSDRILQIIFAALWTSMNVASNCHCTWNNSRQAPSWQFYLHCRIGETGIPCIICIICHQVLRHPSEHGTSWMGKYLLEKAHITNLTAVTESEVTELTTSTVDKTPLAILKRQRSRGITIVSLQRKFIFDT